MSFSEESVSFGFCLKFAVLSILLCHIKILYQKQCLAFTTIPNTNLGFFLVCGLIHAFSFLTELKEKPHYQKDAWQARIRRKYSLLNV